MKLEKVLIACVALYLIVAIPLYLENNRLVGKCYGACEAEGFNIVISATPGEKGVQCWCMDSYSRNEKEVIIKEPV